MTVSATPRKAGPFAGTGAQTAFPFTFKIFATTDVVVTTVVTATAVQTTPVNGVDYTVAMNADQENAPGGAVNMIAAPAVGVSLVISSAVPSTQSVVVANNGGFFPAVFNAEFDRLTVLVQQLEERAGRAMSAPITASGVNLSVSPVANAVLIWDGTGQNIITTPQATLAANLVYNNATYQAAITTTLTLNNVWSGNNTFSGANSLSGSITGTAAGVIDMTLGTLRVKNQAAGDSSTLAANTAFVQAALPQAYAFRNRLINGDMRIDQRNAGASGVAINIYTVDRWSFIATQTGKLTWGQNLTGVAAPAGFPNYLSFLSGSAYAVLAADKFITRQTIEGFNCADLLWGTVNAKSVTLSFLAYADAAGTYSGSLQNSAADRSYPFSFAVAAPNTWTPVSVVIPGDTAGVWLTNASAGIVLSFSLGAGATFSAAAGAWAAGNFIAATGARSIVGTNGGQLDITSVQLEAGIATPFEHRSWTSEFAACRRAFKKFITGAIAFGANSMAGMTWPGDPMRATPTFAISNAGVAGNVRTTSNGAVVSLGTVATAADTTGTLFVGGTGSPLTAGLAYDFTVTLDCDF